MFRYMEWIKVLRILMFFFFKQKTAYEITRRDWSSDVCSSDLMPVWLEVNGEPAVTWMCTPDQLEELATGWLHGEGYIESLDDLVKLRPCAPDLGFWAEVKPERVAAVKGENRKRVLAS